MATIDNNITFEEFRNRCEDKNTLTGKGQLYAGTGSTIVVNSRVAAQTTSTPVPSANALLVQDLEQSSGLNWKPVFDVICDARGEWIKAEGAGTTEIVAKNLVPDAIYEVRLLEPAETGSGVYTCFIAIPTTYYESSRTVSDCVNLKTSLTPKAGGGFVYHTIEAQASFGSNEIHVLYTKQEVTSGFNWQEKETRKLEFSYRRVL